MVATFTVLGAGTLTLGTTPTDFSGEVLSATITHEYEEVGEARTMLDGSVRAANQKRTDGFNASVENDLTAAGLYQYLMTNDGVDVPLAFTPNTTDAASWAGTITCRLPSEIGSDEFGSPIVSEIELIGVGIFTFTPAAAAP